MNLQERNKEIRERMKTYKIAYWMIGEKLDVHENTVIRHMRKEVDKHQKAVFNKAIDEILQERLNQYAE